MTPAVQSSAPSRLRGESPIAPLDVWIAIKTVLHRELGEREWEMWIQHARLWRVMGKNTLGILLPRNGRVIFGAQRHIRRVRRLAHKMMLGVLLSVDTDWVTRELNRSMFEGLEDSDPRKKKLLSRWEQEQIFLTEPFLEPPCSPLWEGFHG
jgi:hypothetical protein